MRLLSWNLHFDGGSDVWESLAGALAADVVFLQEVAEPGPGRWNSVWRAVPERNWGSSVGVAHGKVEERQIRGYDGWVIGGEWRGAPPEIGQTFLYSVHAPTGSKSAPRDTYVAEVQKIVRAIIADRSAGGTVIIGGDFNFKSLGARMGTEAVQVEEPERAALAEFKALGLIPLWTTLHPSRPLPQTLRWARNKVTPYHCDGFLVEESLAGRAVCEVLDAPALLPASDHSPVAAWFLGIT